MLTLFITGTDGAYISKKTAEDQMPAAAPPSGYQMRAVRGCPAIKVCEKEASSSTFRRAGINRCGFPTLPSAAALVQSRAPIATAKDLPGERTNPSRRAGNSPGTPPSNEKMPVKKCP